jgi:hypothetical protein
LRKSRQPRPVRPEGCPIENRTWLGDEDLSEEAENDKPKFDWVARRAACSLPKVYKALRLDVEEDVRTSNAEREDTSAYEFSIEERGKDFAVVLKAKDFSRSVTFSLEDHAILVLDNSGNQMFEITLNFDDQGRCRMKAKEENREPWQVRRMALEDLLFRIY